MKFVTAKNEHGVFVGVMDADSKKLLPLDVAEARRSGEKNFPETMLECIEMGELFIEKVKQLQLWVNNRSDKDELYMPLEKVKLLAPIPRPSKNIFCVGKNYADHALEMGSVEDIPEHVMVFTKAPTTVIGPNGAVMNHSSLTRELDYEGELAVIIGKKGTAICQEDALDHVFGYTILNDITARDLQARHKQFFIGKSLDTTCPMGPWIVHKNSLKNVNKLHIQTLINGEVRQDSCTSKCIFSIEEIISVLSQGMTLEPGDIIATGTPAGVGKGFKPPKFLAPGDRMEIIIEEIGTLHNVIAVNQQ